MFYPCNNFLCWGDLLRVEVNGVRISILGVLQHGFVIVDVGIFVRVIDCFWEIMGHVPALVLGKACGEFVVEEIFYKVILKLIEYQALEVIYFGIKIVLINLLVAMDREETGVIGFCS